MYRKTIATAVAGLLILGLGACGNASDAKTADAGSTSQSQTTKKPAEKKPAEQPADLTGTWKQTNSGSTDSWMEAEITADTITVQWVSDNGDTKSPYWKGSYNAPDKAGDWKWTSQGDTAAMQASLLGSQTPTKDFTYTKAEQHQLGDHRDGHHHSGEDRQAVNDATLTSWSKTLGVRVRTPAGRRQVQTLLRFRSASSSSTNGWPIPAPLHIVPRAHPCQTPRPRMRQPIRNQMRAPLPQGDRVGVDQSGGLRHGRGDCRGRGVADGGQLGVTVQVLMDYRQLLHDSGVCMQ